MIQSLGMVQSHGYRQYKFDGLSLILNVDYYGIVDLPLYCDLALQSRDVEPPIYLVSDLLLVTSADGWKSDEIQ